jgi:hypothetical protein
MQPEVTGGETTNFPPTTSARIDEAPQVQSVRWSCAPVACAELSVSTGTSAKRRHALTRSRWPQNRTRTRMAIGQWSRMGRPAHLQLRQVLSSGVGGTAESLSCGTGNPGSARRLVAARPRHHVRRTRDRTSPTRRKLGGETEGRSSVGAGRLMDRLILSRRSGKNVLKPGLRPSSPHRWRLASRRGQTPGPGFTRSSRQVSSAASPVGVTLPARFGGEPARSPGVCSGIQTSSGPLLERLATGITR